MMNHNYRSRFLVVIQHVVRMQASPTVRIVSMQNSPTVHKLYICKYETCRFNEPFLSFQPKNRPGKSKACHLTEESVALNSGDNHANSLLWMKQIHSVSNTFSFLVMKSLRR